MLIQGVEVEVQGFVPLKGEMANYVEYVKARVPDVTSIRVVMCDDGKVDLNWVAHGEKFERIRRITGYLVGSLARWNSSKQAEEKDRLKHDVHY